MDFEAWLQFGIDNGWAGPPVCETHDGLPMTVEEETAFEAGEDPCIHVMRMYESPEDKAGVEENHSPSSWRATNRGLSL
jgi:hypothetical protein